MIQIVTSEDGDWIAVYKDGYIIDQNHSLYFPSILKDLGIKHERKEIVWPDGQLAPEKIEDFKEYHKAEPIE